ncbi:hypothetical protein NF681_11515 [Comamonadaceae bacterium OTU4NAUVB1]|nr:hypothetical protein NF681_11515 [Comamonadaceae bacterium OTU4NAUVB1]
MLRPYAILAAVLAWAASAGGAFLYGKHVGAEHEIATQARIDKSIETTRDAAQQGAANAIAALKPVNKTIVQKTQREITENVVYRDCRVPIDGVRLANEAITGQPAEPARDQ